MKTVFYTKKMVNVVAKDVTWATCRTEEEVSIA